MFRLLSGPVLTLVRYGMSSCLQDGENAGCVVPGFGVVRQNEVGMMKKKRPVLVT